MLQSIDLKEIPDAHPIARMARFWTGQAAHNASPQWSAFDAVEHPKILPWVLLMQPEEGGRYRYTVCGSGCSDIFGFSYQGKLFGEGLPADAVAERAQEFIRASEIRAPIFSRTRLPIPNRDFIHVFRGVFPFFDRDGGLARILLVLAPVNTTV